MSIAFGSLKVADALTNNIYSIACDFLQPPSAKFKRRGNTTYEAFYSCYQRVLTCIATVRQEKSPQLKDWKDQYSYSIGMQLGFTLREKKGDINPDIVAAASSAITLSDDQVKDVTTQLQKET